MEYDKEEMGLRISLNEEELPFDGYFIGSRNYIRRINDIDMEKVRIKGKNGWALVGGFEDKDSTILFDDVLYLSCCRENGQKDIYHLFTIKKGEPTLIKESKRQQGAVKYLWKYIEEFIANRPKKTLQELFNIITKAETDKHRLQEFAVALHSYTLGFEFDNQYTLPKSRKEQLKQATQEAIDDIKGGE